MRWILLAVSILVGLVAPLLGAIGILIFLFIIIRRHPIPLGPGERLDIDPGAGTFEIVSDDDESQDS